MKRLFDIALESNCTLEGNIIWTDRIDFAENFDATLGSARFSHEPERLSCKLSVAKSRFAGAFQSEDVVFYFEG